MRMPTIKFIHPASALAELPSHLGFTAV
jgi:hypothetical protein